MKKKRRNNKIPGTEEYRNSKQRGHGETKKGGEGRIPTECAFDAESLETLEYPYSILHI